MKVEARPAGLPPAGTRIRGRRPAGVQKFACFPTDGHPYPPDLRSAHLVGNDNVPVRGEVAWAENAILCKPRTQDPVGLSLLWTVPGSGTVQLQTTRLPARDRPYHLHVELARHLLMRISVKREEWGLFDYSGMDEIAAKINQARDAFIAALQAADDAREAARLADQSLTSGLEAAELMSSFHADVFLARRQQTGGFSHAFLGAAVPPKPSSAKLVKRKSPATILAPAMDRALEFLDQRLPGPVAGLEKQFAEAGLTGVGTGLDNVARAAG